MSATDRQHRIPSPPPITEAMCDHALGCDERIFLGRTVAVTYAVPDSDRGEVLLRLDNGWVVEMSCDPSWGDDDPRREREPVWSSCLYDATDTPAGRAMQKLGEGQWI
jgi:hypothetical protein